MTYEPDSALALVDPLGTLCVPDFDTAAETCPSCREPIDDWSLEAAFADLGLCACQGCGAVLAA